LKVHAEGNTAEDFEKNILNFKKNLKLTPKLYKSRNEMAEKYMIRVKIKKENALMLIERSSYEIESNGEKFYVFKHDQQLLRPTTMKLNHKQVLQFIDRINCPTLLILGHQSDFQKFSKFAL
jgi:hypothetical protein